MFGFWGRSENQEIYPYDFVTSGYSWIDAIIAELKGQSEWDYTQSIDDAFELQNRIAEGNLLSTYPSSEKQAFVSFLQKEQAGPHISTYAWGLFLQRFIQTGQPTYAAE